MNHGLNKELGQWGRLAILAVLWDELAGIHNCERIRQEFRPELEHLNRFQSDYPEVSPKVLISLLEQKVIYVFRERFSRNGILALRARLSCSNLGFRRFLAGSLN